MWPVSVWLHPVPRTAHQMPHENKQTVDMLVPAAALNPRDSETTARGGARNKRKENAVRLRPNQFPRLSASCSDGGRMAAGGGRKSKVSMWLNCVIRDAAQSRETRDQEKPETETRSRLHQISCWQLAVCRMQSQFRGWWCHYYSCRAGVRILYGRKKSSNAKSGHYLTLNLQICPLKDAIPDFYFLSVYCK